MRLLTACVAALLAGSTATAQPRHDGLASWPNIANDGEGGCYVRFETTTAVAAYAEPRATSRRVRTVQAGRRIDLNDRTESLRVLGSYGRVRTRRALRLDVIGPGRRPGEHVQTTLSLPAGAVLETKWFAGSEGSDFLYGGTEYRGDVPGEEWVWESFPDYRRNFTVERHPTVENWVRLAPRAGQPAAWLSVDQRGVEWTGDECYD